MNLDDFLGSLQDKVRKTYSKPQEWDELVENTIEEQQRIANGEKVPSTSPGKFKKSWRDGVTGKVVVKIGITEVFQGKESVMDEKQFKSFLGLLRDGWNTHPGVKEAFEGAKSRKEASDLKKRESQARNTANTVRVKAQMNADDDVSLTPDE